MVNDVESIITWYINVGVCKVTQVNDDYGHNDDNFSFLCENLSFCLQDGGVFLARPMMSFLHAEDISLGSSYLMFIIVFGFCLIFEKVDNTSHES